MFDEFLEWFEGDYNNWKQASSWPSHYAHILLKHEKIGDNTFYCEQKFKHDGQIYRKKEIKLEWVGEEIIARNPVCDIHFQRVALPDGWAFVGRNYHSPFVNGGYLRSEAILRHNQYIVIDRGYDENGKQVWGSEYGPFVFDKKV